MAVPGSGWQRKKPWQEGVLDISASGFSFDGDELILPRYVPRGMYSCLSLVDLSSWGLFNFLTAFNKREVDEGPKSISNESPFAKGEGR